MQEDQLQLAMIELEYAVLTLVMRRPPPDKTPVDETLNLFKEAIRAGGDASQILASITEALANKLPHPERLRAVTAVLTSALDPVAHPWSDTLELVSEEWATWGTPWIMAAEHASQQGEFKWARKYLASAHRLMPVAKGHLRHIIDDYRRAVHHRHEYNTEELWAASLLALHAPTLSNLAKWLECAHELGCTSEVKRVRDWCFSFHGTDPEKWDVLEQYDDLSAAGALCCLLNIVAVRERQKQVRSGHNFRLWNRAGIDYLQRSLKAPRKRGEENEGWRERREYYASIRLCEAYAAELYIPDIAGSQEERQRLLDEARAFILEVGQSHPSRAYDAQRHWVKIAVGEARHMRATQRPDAEIHAVVEQTDRDYHNLYEFAFPHQRYKVATWHSLFLFDFDRLDLLAKMAERTINPDLADVAIKYRTRSTRQAIKKLNSLLEGPLPYNKILGYCQLLFHYLERSRLDSLRLPESLRSRAQGCLGKYLPRLVAACADELREQDILQAKKYLKIAQFADADPLAPNLVHLAARIGEAEIAEGRSPDDVLTQLTVAFHERPALRRDPFCQSIFLRIIANSASWSASDVSSGVSAHLDPAMVWAMATETLGPQNGRYYYFNLTNALLWQLESGQLHGWVDRVLLAAGTFPEDIDIQKLGVQLWEKHGPNAVGVLLDLFEKAASCTHLLTADGEPWVITLLERLPGAFFFTEPVPQTMAAWITSHMHGDLEAKQRTQAIARIFIEGLVKGQLEMWGEQSLCQERTAFAVAWISSHVPEEFLPDRWAQWLGSQRGQCEYAIVRRLRASIEQLHRELLDSREQGQEAWLGHLRAFFVTMRGGGSVAHEEENLSHGGEIVLTFCTAAVANYHPAAPDPDYWSKLNGLVEWWKTTLSSEEIPRVMQQAWMQLHHRLEAVIAQRIIDVTLPALHNFQASMRSTRGQYASADIPHHWVQRFSTIIERTKQYLDAHRWAEPTLVDLRTVLEEVVYHPPLTPTKRDIDPDTPRLWAIRPAQPVMVNGDRELLTEVIRALLDNARRHTPPKDRGGWIWAEVRQEHGWAVVEVTDHGSRGVSDATLERLNDRMGKPFSGGNSTGYGTRHCHRVMRLHQGRLEFRHASSGLTAEIRLPLADDEGQSNENL